MAAPHTRVTMSDVARLAGVSRVTASKVLNDPAAGSPEVRRRIEEACERLLYVPNQHARSLVSGSSRTIGMVVASLTNHFYGALVEAAEAEAMRRGFGIVCRCSGEDPAREAEMVKHLLSLNVSALLATPAVTSANRELWQRTRERIPVLFLDHFFGPDDSYVIADHAAGAEAVARHLLLRGRTPALLEASAPSGHRAVRGRRLGYLRGMRAAGRKPVFLRGEAAHHGYPERYAYEAVRRHLALHPAPDALFCTNDLHALGALRALRDEGLVPGKDVLVAGYDDQAFAAYLDPPLTSVRQPTLALGTRAVALVTDALEGEARDRRRPLQETLPVELHARASTAPPRG